MAVPKTRLIATTVTRLATAAVEGTPNGLWVMLDQASTAKVFVSNTSSVVATQADGAEGWRLVAGVPIHIPPEMGGNDGGYSLYGKSDTADTIVYVWPRN